MPATEDEAGPNGFLPADSRRLVARVADAIAALMRAYQPPEVIFFKTMDNILIALGAPFGLRIFARANPELSFDTLATTDILIGEREIPVGEALGVRILRPLGGVEDPAAARVAIDEASQFLADLAATLGEARSRGEFGPLCERLMKGLEKAAATAPSAPAPANSGVSSEQAAGQVEDVLGKIDTFLTAGNHRFGLQWMTDELNCPRFLFFHRYIGTKGVPAIRLNLLKSQRLCFDKLLGTEQREAFENQAPQVFADRRWRIDDSFRSGVSGWVRWPWQRRCTAEEAARARPVREALVALAHGPGRDLAGDDVSSALVVPIHVDGMPWLALAGIFPQDGADGPFWAPTFYRDLLPYLTTTVRTIAERAYLHRVGDIARDAIVKGRTGLEQVTEALAPVAATFPYDRLALSPATGKAGHDINWRGEKVRLRISDLPLTHTRVNYNRLRAEEVARAFSEGERDADAAEARHMQSRLRSYVNIGHTLKNLMMCTGWPATAKSVAQVDHNYERIVADGFPPAKIEQIGRAVGYANRSLSLIWIVEGFGHFIRLSGARAGNFEWGKFSKWVNTDEEVVDESSVADCYAESIFRLAKSIAFGWDWPRVTVRVEGRPAVRLWSGGMPEKFSVEQLHFPPFRKGCEGGYVIATCLLEPIVNAIRALNALPGHVSENDPRATLDIVVAQDPLKPAGVVVSITNLSMRDLPERLSGLESTKALTEDMGLGTFDPPAVRSAGEGLFLITTKLRLSAASIVEAIRKAKDEKDDQDPAQS